MPALPPVLLLHCKKKPIFHSNKKNAPPQTEEQIMISLVPATQQVVPFAGRRLRAFVRAALNSWLAHYARLAEFRVGGL